MTRAEVMAAVMLAVDDLETPLYDGDEPRDELVIGMLQAIDWGAVPVPKLRALFRSMVRMLPIGVVRELGEKARHEVDINKAMHIEHAYEDATGKAYPYRGCEPPAQGAN